MHKKEQTALSEAIEMAVAELQLAAVRQHGQTGAGYVAAQLEDAYKAVAGKDIYFPS